MLREANGFLFIGDPHVSSDTPGRRNDENFQNVIFNKLEACINIANEKKQVPVFLGDIFDKPIERDESIKARMMRILMKSWTQPVTIVGNHDKTYGVLTEVDTLNLFGESGLLKIQKTTGPIEEFLIEGTLIGLGGTSYGQIIPRTIKGEFSKETKGVIWLTHHDIGFEGTPPGWNAPAGMEGCSLVVNGHLHLHKPAVTAGKTMWFNPGNITRQTVDTINHIPSAWEFTKKGGLKRHVLPHPKNAFDLTGRLVAAGETYHYDNEEMGGHRESHFASLLRNEIGTDMSKTDDGSVLLEDMERIFEKMNISDEVKEYVMRLHAEAVGNNENIEPRF